MHLLAAAVDDEGGGHLDLQYSGTSGQSRAVGAGAQARQRLAIALQAAVLRAARSERAGLKCPHSAGLMLPAPPKRRAAPPTLFSIIMLRLALFSSPVICANTPSLYCMAAIAYFFANSCKEGAYRPKAHGQGWRMAADNSRVSRAGPQHCWTLHWVLCRQQQRSKATQLASRVQNLRMTPRLRVPHPQPSSAAHLAGSAVRCLAHEHHHLVLVGVKDGLELVGGVHLRQELRGRVQAGGPFAAGVGHFSNGAEGQHG